jgi:hypothetical protein
MPVAVRKKQPLQQQQKQQQQQQQQQQKEKKEKKKMAKAAPPPPSAEYCALLNDTTCSICLEELSQCSHQCVRLLCCGHALHTHCYWNLQQFRGVGRKCPLCRSGFVASAQEELEAYTRHARAGRAWAQYALGLACYTGPDEGFGARWAACASPLARSLANARQWLERAARGGSASAQYGLGLMHHLGQGGLVADDKRAAEWMVKCARQDGHSGATAFLTSLVRAAGGKEKADGEKEMEAAVPCFSCGVYAPGVDAVVCGECSSAWYCSHECLWRDADVHAAVCGHVGAEEKERKKKEFGSSSSSSKELCPPFAASASRSAEDGGFRKKGQFLRTTLQERTRTSEGEREPVPEPEPESTDRGNGANAGVDEAVEAAAANAAAIEAAAMATADDAMVGADDAPTTAHDATATTMADGGVTLTASLPSRTQHLNIYEHLLLRTTGAEVTVQRDTAPNASSSVLQLTPSVTVARTGNDVSELSGDAPPPIQVPRGFLRYYYNSIDAEERAARAAAQLWRTPRKPAALPPAIGANTERARHALTKEPYFLDIPFAGTVNTGGHDDGDEGIWYRDYATQTYPWLMQFLPARQRRMGHMLLDWSKRALQIFYRIVFVMWSIMFVWAVNVDTQPWPKPISLWPAVPFQDASAESGIWRGSGHNLFMKPRAQERLGRSVQNMLYLPVASDMLCQAVTGGGATECMSTTAAPHRIVDPNYLPGMSGQKGNMTKLFPQAQPSTWAGPLYHRLFGAVSVLVVMSIYYKARLAPILRDKLMTGWIATITSVELLLLRDIRAPVVVVLPHVMRLALLGVVSYFSFKVLSAEEYQRRRNCIGRILAFGGILIALPCQTFVLKQIIDPVTYEDLPELTVFASFSLANRLLAHFAGIRLFVLIDSATVVRFSLLKNIALFGTACLVSTSWQVIIRGGKAADLFILFPAIVGPFIAVILLGEAVIFFRLHRLVFVQSLGAGMEWRSHKDSLL